MKRTIITAMLIIALCAFAFDAGAYTLSGSVSGAVSMGGITYINAVDCGGGNPPAYYTGVALAGNGAYVIDNVPTGDYIILAFQDRDNDQWVSLGDYLGWYGAPLPEAVTITGNRSGLNIMVRPLPSTTISGFISYGGSASGLIVVEAATNPFFTQGNRQTLGFNPSGAGYYTVFVEPGVYYLRAIMDSDINLAYSPGEPWGYYGFPGALQTVNVVSGPAVNVNFGLNDPPPVSLTLTPLNPPVTIPASGGSFGFQVLAVNPLIVPMQLDAWLDLVLPNGYVYGPLILVRNLVIPPSGQVSHNLNQAVPGSAPAGQYYYRASLGYRPYIVAATDQFPFTKLGALDAAFSPDGWNVEGWNQGASSAAVQPDEFAVLAAYPNPFNPQATLSFRLQEAGMVKLAVYDILGAEVAVLCDGFRPAGTYETIFDGTELPSGVYFAALKAGNVQQTMKLLLIK